MGPLDVVYESIFGPASKDDWKPMSLATFFSEGWDSPFVNAPEGTNGGPEAELARRPQRRLRAVRHPGLLLHEPHEQRPGPLPHAQCPVHARPYVHHRQPVRRLLRRSSCR